MYITTSMYRIGIAAYASFLLRRFTAADHVHHYNHEKKKKMK